MNLNSSAYGGRGSWQLVEGEALSKMGHKVKTRIKGVEECYFTESGGHVHATSISQSYLGPIVCIVPVSWEPNECPSHEKREKIKRFLA